MIAKNDLILLLTNLQENGIDIGNRVLEVVKSPGIPLDVLKFINDNRQLELTSFYDKLRRSYNNKKSKLYISIVKDIDNPTEVITTLSSYALQAILYSKKVQDNQMFLRHARVKEVNLALAKYFTDFDLTICTNLLGMIKADLIACETISGRRTQQ